MNLLAIIAAITRRLQNLRPARPLRGLTRFTRLCAAVFPPYEGVIRLPDGAYFSIDSQHPAQCSILFSGAYQPPLTAFLRGHTSPGDYCLDLGSNLGFYAVMLGQWSGKTGRVVAFEANPAMVRIIQRNLELNGFTHVEVIPKIVDREAGIRTFYISPDPGKSSIHTAFVNRPVETITLPAVTIDEVVRDWSRLDVIKSDVEGNDCQALLGGRNAIQRFRPVIAFEYSYADPPEVAAELFDLLDASSYQCFALLMNGNRMPFERKLPDGLRVVNVVCLP